MICRERVGGRHSPILGVRVNILERNHMKPIAVFVSLLMSATALLQGALLFEENFSGASKGQGWNTWSQWQGSSTAVIDEVAGRMVGSFPSDPTTVANIAYRFDTDYRLDAQAYRFSFELAGGYPSRHFQIALLDSDNDRVGLQYSDLNNARSIAGVSVAGGVTQLFHEGGWSGTTSWPVGYDPNAFYRVYIDINGTSSAIMVGDDVLEANRVRVIYNALNQGVMERLVIEFDLPGGFTTLSGIRLARDVRSDQVRYVSDLSLQAYAIPEPGAAGLVGIVLAGWWGWRQRRGGCQKSL